MSVRFAGEKIVVVGAKALAAKKTKEETLPAEPVHEPRRLEELSSVDGGAARDDKDASVNGIGGAQLPVMAKEVEAPDQVHNRDYRPLTRCRAKYTLVCRHHSHVVVLEGGQDRSYEFGAGPVDVVVCKNRDFGVDVRYGVGHLTALRGAEDGAHADSRRGVLFLVASGDFLAAAAHPGADGDDENGSWPVLEYGEDTLYKLFVTWVNRGKNHGDVSVGPFGPGLDRGRLVSPASPNVAE